MPTGQLDAGTQVLPVGDGKHCSATWILSPVVTAAVPNTLHPSKGQAFMFGGVSPSVECSMMDRCNTPFYKALLEEKVEDG